MEISIGQLLEYVSKAGVLAAFAIFIYGFAKKEPWWVMVREVSEKNSIIAGLEARIQRFEDREAKQHELLTRLVDPVIPKRS